MTQLLAFFTVAADKTFVDDATCKNLLNSISLKTQSAAACLAIVLKNDKQRASFNVDFLKMAQAGQVAGVLFLGELGKLTDLSSDKKIFETIKNAFQHAEEQVRLSASISLGNITIGNPNFFLKKVFGMVAESEAKQKYLFLNTIREIVISDSSCLSAYLTPLMELLMSQTNHPEDSIRSIVAECLGRLFIVYPEDLIE